MNHRLYQHQTRFTLTFEAKSDLHIGSGEEQEFQYKDKEGKTHTAGYSAVCRDWHDKPCIPATSLKGPMRRLLEQNDADALFGTAKSSGASDQAGLLWLWPARYKSLPAEEPVSLPFWNKDKGTFILPHNRSDKNDDTHLFHIEYIPKGTKFVCEGLYLGDLTSANKQLKPLLKKLACGMEIGGRKNNNRGRVVLVGDEVEFRTTILPQFDINKSCINLDELTDTIQFKESGTKSDGKQCATGNPCAVITFTLETDGPFYSRDPNTSLRMRKPVKKVVRNNFKQKRNRKPASDVGKIPKNEIEYTAALMRDSEKVLLNGEALKHALRKICAYEENRQNSEQIYDDPEAQLESPDKIDDLTGTQRLFGITGWRGLLSIDEIEHTGQGMYKYTHGLKLDVFTNGPIKGAKYQTQSIIAPVFKVRMSLMTRGEYPTENDRELLKNVCEKIKERGLELAAETATGFGWFNVKGCQIVGLDDGGTGTDGNAEAETGKTETEPVK